MVIPINDFPKIREEELKGKKIVCTSGFFDPIHPGHVSCILEAKKFGDILVVIVDGDSICVTKKGKPFIPEKDRADIVDAIKGVDYVVIYDHPTRYDVAEALDIVKPDIFAKGGDRDKEDAKSGPVFLENEVLKENNGRVEFNVGAKKIWSSSNYLQEWVDFINNKDN
jgi:cytidyltransferase-like protein